MSALHRLHVLHVIDGLALGGAERMLVDLANRAHADGHLVSACVTRHDTTLAGELAPGIELLVLGRRTRYDLGALLRFARWVRAHDVDVIHGHLRSTVSLLLALRMARLISAPIVFHDHLPGNLDSDVPAWLRLGHRQIAQYVGVCEDRLAWARGAGIAASRTRLIANGFDPARLASAPASAIRAELGLAPATVLGVLVASIRPVKGVEILLDALAQARTRASWHVIVAGPDTDPAYTEAMRRRSAELGLASRVTFLGPRRDIPGLLAASDFAVLCSHTESGPLVLLEYLGAGLPVVSTLVGHIGRQLAEAGVPGFVPPGDAGAFARELEALLQLPAEARRARGARGRELLADGWDLGNAMRSWYEVYRDAVAAKP